MAAPEQPRERAGRRGDSKACVAHLVEAWLRRTQTFIFNLVRHQGHPYRPVVFAGEAIEPERFPVEEVLVLKSGDVPWPVRALRRLRAYAARLPTTYDERLIRLARRRGCALVHAHFGPMGWRALPAARRLGIPVVTTFYGVDLASPQVTPAWRADYPELFREGALFLCEGPAMADHLAAIGAPRERIRLAKIGIDLDRLPFRPRSREPEPLVVVQAGRLVEKKGVDLAIRAFALALPELGAAELWLVGDGPERHTLERLAEDLGVSDRVRFLGSLPYDEYARALARAQIGIQPSRTASDGDTEGGAPTVLLEMQASGMPVVATSHADIPHVVAAPWELAAEEDVAGIGEALIRAARLSDQEWTERIESGRKLVEHEHDTRRLAQHVEGLYEEALTLDS